MTRLVYILGVFACLNLSLHSSPVTIKGLAPDYKGQEITFYAYSNMISFMEKELGSCEVNDTGGFHCRIDLGEIRLVYTHLGIYNCYFYAEPGMIYQVSLPVRREKSLSDQANPYFQSKSVHLSARVLGTITGNPVPVPSEELNFLIRAFNDSFYPYYYKFVVSAYGNQIDRNEINKVVKDLTAPFDSVFHPFFNDYVKYRTGLLDHYGAGLSIGKIIEEYFLDSHVRYFNPAYMELFNEVFQNFFEAYALSNPGRQLSRLLNREKDYSAIQYLLMKDESLVNDTLREMVLVKGFYDGFYDEKYIRTSMIELLDSVKINSSIPYVRGTVQDIMVQLSRLLPGYKPEDFALYDSDSTLVHLSDFRDNYIYLNFCNSFSYYCIKEYEYLKILQTRMVGEKLKIITILVDDTFDMMKNLVRNNNYPWTFLHFGNEPEVLDHFNIQAYPAYFLIGPEGEMLLSPAPSPMENFEMTFRRIKESR